LFGYIAIDKPEMKLKEFETFRAYYCGLCRELGESYGQPVRFALSYDCAFLYVLAAAAADSRPAYAKKRCAASPFRKKPYAMDQGAAYAAAVNVLLAVGSLRDHGRTTAVFPPGRCCWHIGPPIKRQRRIFPGPPVS